MRASKVDFREHTSKLSSSTSNVLEKLSNGIMNNAKESIARSHPATLLPWPYEVKT